MPSGATPGAERFWVRFSGTVPGLFRGRASNASGLRLVTNDPDQPLLVVSVLAESGAPDLTVFPSFINFEEDVAVGASGTVRLTVRNDGRATATLRGIDVVEVPIPSDGPATPSRPFSAATDAPLPIALSMLENTEIEVTYRPTGQQDIAALRIFSDDPDEDPLIVEVRGGPTPRLQVDPPSILTFAAQGPAPTIEEVTLCNAGSAPLTITGFGLSVEVPSAGDDFRLDPPCPFPCSTSIELCSPRSAACTDACRSIRLRYANDDDSSVDEATFSIFSTDPGNSEYRLVLRAP